MPHRLSLRTLLTPTIVALALGGCSFSYSSGSSPPRSSSSRSNHGKPAPSAGGRSVDNREKALPRSTGSGSGSKPIPKASDTTPSAPERDKPATTDTDEVVDPPKRNTTPPRRTKVPPKRATPDDPSDATDSADTDTPSANDTIRSNPTPTTPPATPPATNNTIKANPSTTKPPATNNTLVAPR